MRAVLQRSSEASVTVSGEIVGKIGKGLTILLGVEENDTEAQLEKLISKIPKLRIFEDEDGKMNRSLLDISGEILLISQFTLYADCKKGRRPSFIKAAPPNHAEALYEKAKRRLSEDEIKVECGIFGADMKVSIINDGPVTIILDSEDL